MVSIAERFLKRRVDPRKETRVADPSLRTRAVGEKRTASLSEMPAGLGIVQWPQWGVPGVCVAADGVG